jgi:hypothetical protein
MTKILSLSLASSLVFAAFACQSAGEPNTSNGNAPANSVQPTKTPVLSLKPEQTIPIDIARLAGKSIDEFDRFFEKIAEGKTVEPVGEFRLYKIAGQSKGLSVRFYGNRAKSFNLISDNIFETSKEALMKLFNIDVGSLTPVKKNREPLTESYQGTFGGVKFKKISAKKQADGKGFIFVLAEVSE